MSHSNRFRRPALAGMLSLLIVLLLFANPASPRTLTAEGEGHQPDSAQIWLGWVDLGVPPGVSTIETPVVGQHQDGRLEVFVASDGTALVDMNIYRIAQVAPSSLDWSAWSDLGGTGGGRTAPSVVSNADGRLEVFAQYWYLGVGGPDPGDHSEVANISQVVPNGAWGSWTTVGQPSAGNVIDLYGPHAARNADGRLAVLVQGEDINFWLTQQTGAGVNNWTGWTNLGPPAGWYAAPSLSISWEKDGRLDVFTVASNYEVYHNVQAAPNGNFAGWVSYGRPHPVTLGPPFATRNQDGRQEFYAAGSDGNIWHKYQLAANGYWVANWGNLERPIAVSMNAPIVGHLPDGEQCIFSRGHDTNIWSRCQTCPNCGWGLWHNLGKPPTAFPTDQLATGNSSNGLPSLFVVGTDGHLWVNNWTKYQIVLSSKVYLPMIIR